ncbi:GntR family transcriptional regulator [Gryllotalpicola ginsengisoli]|uniref:GntR family transcriptional regulator n=1 Tax=Gryllotalpicola ginsengisoli TaxID=444608 RepID=UPI0003B754FF|nr:GntR family transcriptional regulator [Gryllotalpicola ginsengisoli]
MTIRTPLNIDGLTDAIKQSIAEGEFPPGQRLTEAAVSERYGVGRTAVRTAFARLEQDGLVVKEPNKGISVRSVSEEEAIEITKIRRALEALAAEEAAVKATDKEIAELLDHVREMKSDLEAGDLFHYSTANAAMHDKILAISANPRLSRIVQSLKIQAVKFQFRTALAPGRSAESFAEHSEIVSAIAARDPERAKAAMELHLTHLIGALHRTRATASIRDPKEP